MIAKCQCQWCDGNIEFDPAEFQESGSGASQIFGQTVACPHCGKETMLTLPLPKMIYPVPAEKKFSVKVKLIAFGVLILILGYICFICWKFPDAIDDISIGVFHGFTAIFVIIFAILTFVLACFWLVFPWMVYSLLSKIHGELEKIERNTRK
jgi:uncharacterized protein YybS (DUF2232 family)